MSLRGLGLGQEGGEGSILVVALDSAHIMVQLSWLQYHIQTPPRLRLGGGVGGSVLVATPDLGLGFGLGLG